MSLVTALIRIRRRAICFHLPTRAMLVNKSEHFLHMTYLGAVSVEAHGMYAIAAAALLVVTVVGVFVKGAGVVE